MSVRCRSNRNLDMLGKPEYQKPLGEKTKGQNQKHNQPSYGVNAGSRTRATLEVSAHTTAPALLLTRKADVETRDRSFRPFIQIILSTVWSCWKIQISFHNFADFQAKHMALFDWHLPLKKSFSSGQKIKMGDTDLILIFSLNNKNWARHPDNFKQYQT